MRRSRGAAVAPGGHQPRPDHADRAGDRALRDGQRRPSRALTGYSARRGGRPHRRRARHLGRRRPTRERFVRDVRDATARCATCRSRSSTKTGARCRCWCRRRASMMDRRDYLVHQRARRHRDASARGWSARRSCRTRSIGIAFTRERPLRAGQPALRADVRLGRRRAGRASPARVVWASDGDYDEIERADRPAAGARRAGRVRARDARAATAARFLVPPAGAADRPDAPGRRRHDLDRRGRHRAAPGRAGAGRARATTPRPPTAPRAPSWPTPATRSARR